MRRLIHKILTKYFKNKMHDRRINQKNVTKYVDNKIYNRINYSEKYKKIC